MLLYGQLILFSFLPDLRDAGMDSNLVGGGVQLGAVRVDLDGRVLPRQVLQKRI